MKLIIKAKKSLGQNFLIDKNIINNIAKVVNINKDSIVLEIGPGYGHLTECLLSLNPKKIYAVEKDKKLFLFLKEKFKENKKVKIINQDILDFLKKNMPENNLIVFGNLPYNISTKILADLIMLKKWPPWYKRLVFMFQKEVADRIICKKQNKQYGRLSVLANWRLDIKKHFNISKNCFYPKPRIDSTLLSFSTKSENKFPLKNPKNLEIVTRVLFSNRRKMINKSFKKLFSNKIAMTKKTKIDLNKRPEELSGDLFYELAVLYEKLFD